MKRDIHKIVKKVRDNEESILFLALVLLYVCFELSWLKTWEFSNDDTLAMLFSRQMIDGPRSWFGIQSSMGIPHTSLVYSIYAIFLWLYPKIVSLQVCVIYFLLIAHGTLMKTADQILGKYFSYLCSLCFFFSPVFALFYFQRFWEPAILPALTILAFYSLLQYLNEGKALKLWLCVAAISIAISCHLLSAILYVPIGIILWFFQPRKLPPLALALIVSTALLGLSPWIHWLYSSHPLALLLPLLFPFLFFFKRIQLSKQILAALAAIVLLGTLLAFGYRGFLGAFSVLRDLISANSVYLPRHVGWISFSEGTEWFYPETLLLLLYCFRSAKNYAKLSINEKCLLIWIAGSIFPFFLACASLKLISHQWAIFIFPVVWIGIMKPISELYYAGKREYRILAIALIAVLILPAIFNTNRWEQRLKTEDGTGWHAASLGVKEKIIATIWSQSNRPLVFLASDRGADIHDFHAWSFLNGQAAEIAPGTTENQNSFWYIQSNGALQEDARIHKELLEKCGLVQKTGYVELFRCSKYLKIGTRI